MDQDHHLPRLLELLDEFLGAPCTHNALSLGLIFEETIDLGDCAVEGHDGEAVVGGVEDQVLAHDREANETEVTTVAHIVSMAVVSIDYNQFR